MLLLFVVEFRFVVCENDVIVAWSPSNLLPTLLARMTECVHTCRTSVHDVRDREQIMWRNHDDGGQQMQSQQNRRGTTRTGQQWTCHDARKSAKY
jgi:hypothetical protein